MIKSLCHLQLSEIQDACLSCDFHLDCFPMDDETKEMMEVS